ncbi:MAG: DUF2306 domain-containing protein [Leptospiraceae bacterium]|nr:DUF2306 domain-containing protein [Leptospiraceae bacterium]
MDTRNSKKILETIGYGIVFTLAFIGIAVSISGYLLPHDLYRKITILLYGSSYATEQLPLMAKSPVVEFFHRFAGFLYMVIGPMQFMPNIRKRYLTLHRLAGRVFVTLSIVLSATGLVMVVLFPFSGIQESIPTFFFGLIFFYSNCKALFHAMRKEITLHREWMIRGFSIGLGISLIRVIFLIFSYSTNGSDKEVLITSFWLGWSMSMLVGECWIGYTRKDRSV